MVQGKWIDQDLMRSRDEQRHRDHQRNLTVKQVKEIEQEREVRQMAEQRKISKKSQRIAEKAVLNKIRDTVQCMSQNGYISFSSYLQTLYLLKLTSMVGAPSLPVKKSE